MEILLNRFRNLTVLLLVIFAQLVLLAYQVKSNQDVRLIRVWAVTAVTPLARVLEFVRQNTIGVVENYIVLVNVREENRRLKNELGETKLAVHFLRSELQSAERAEALRAFQARTPSRTLPARIIGTGTGANSRVVYVDQGSVAGVMSGMAVVTPEGIVGKVIGAYPTASQVLLITEDSFAAGVISDKNKVRGTLEGLGQAKCRVNYVQNEEKVEVGEVFYTTGDDRVFPRGLPAAKTVAVREGETFKEIFVVPTGLQTGTEEVLIVLEGVHQALPSHAQPADTSVYLAPPVKKETPEASSATGASGAPTGAVAVPGATSLATKTEADRLRERYKGIAERQGVVLGQGYKPPDFKVSAETNPTPPAPDPGGAAGATSGAGASARQTSPAPATPGAAPTGRPPVTVAKPKPLTTNPGEAAGTPRTGTASQRSTAPPESNGTTPTGGPPVTVAKPKPLTTNPGEATGTPRTGTASQRSTNPPEPNGTAPTGRPPVTVAKPKPLATNPGEATGTPRTGTASERSTNPPESNGTTPTGRPPATVAKPKPPAPNPEAGGGTASGTNATGRQTPTSRQPSGNGQGGRASSRPGGNAPTTSQPAPPPRDTDAPPAAKPTPNTR